MFQQNQCSLLFLFFFYIFSHVFLTTLLLLILLFRIYPLLPTLLPFSFLFFFRLLFVFVSLSEPIPPPISFQILKASNFSFSLISPSAVRFSFSQCRRKKSNQPHNISRWIIESLREKKC